MPVLESEEKKKIRRTRKMATDENDSDNKTPGGNDSKYVSDKPEAPHR